MEAPKVSVPAAAVPDLPGSAPTANIIASMLQAAPKTSDLIFSPGRAPQVELHGSLMQLKIKGVGMLSAEDTARIAADLIGRNNFAVEKLKEEGSCDISYSLAKLSRFRVNIFTQRGSCAIVMRVIPSRCRISIRCTFPKQLRTSRGSTPRHRAGHRSHRQRQILDAGRLRQQDQRGKGLPRHHHRRPHRISARA